MTNPSTDWLEEGAEKDRKEMEEAANEIPVGTPETPMTEAPVSINVRGYYRGFSVQITKRHPANYKLELEKIMETIDNMVAKGFKPSWAEETNGKHAPVTTANKTFVCSTCGAPAEYKEGVSSKTNNPWKGVFCSVSKEHVKWL